MIIFINILIVIFILSVPLSAAQGDPGSVDESPIQNYSYRVVAVYPHDPNAFTQGLVYSGGRLYESTGGYFSSTLREVDLETGKVLRQYTLPSYLFGEGLVLWKDRLIQLTWRSHVGLVYDSRTFRPLANFSYPTEGWGITQNGRHLIMSDGTSNLYFLDPESFEEQKKVEVTDRGRSVPLLNELEYVNGEVYANVWMTDLIAMISPDTGKVIGWIDLTGILKERNETDNVLNGIAYDSQGDRLFVTGKLWPKLFEIELVP
jgi:glutamine cyclotransferase